MTSQPLKQDDFLRLLLRNEREIQRYVMAIVPDAVDAQEIVQETAVELWKKVEQYDPARPFVAWACRFAAIAAKEFLRKRGRWNGFLDEEVASLLLARRTELAPELDRRLVPLRDCVSALPVKNRNLVHDYYIEQTPIEKISEDVGRSAAALYKSLQRIRAALLDCVSGKLSSPEASP